MSPSREEHFLSLVISRLRAQLTDEEVLKRFRVHPSDFTRQRKLSFAKVVVLILRGWKLALQTRLNRLVKALGEGAPVPPTASAFCQARTKLKPSFFKWLNKELRSFFYDWHRRQQQQQEQQEPEAHSSCCVPGRFYRLQRWHHYRLLAVDGTYLNLPDTPTTREQYSLQRNQHEAEGEYVQALGSFLYDVLNRLVINAEIRQIQAEKKFIFEAHSQFCRPGEDLVLHDRLYADYSVISWYAKAGIDFVIRCPPLSGTFRSVCQFVQNDDQQEEVVVTLQATKGQRAFLREHDLPATVPVRLIKVPLANEAGGLEVLMTSLLDQEQCPLEEFKELYHLRWQEEVYFGHLKSSWEVERVSSKKPLGIEQDFHAAVFLSSLAGVLSAYDDQQVQLASQQRGLQYRYQLNRTSCAATVTDYVVELFLDHSKSPESVVQELRRLFRTSTLPVRPNRKRKKKRIRGKRQLRFHKYGKRIWA